MLWMGSSTDWTQQRKESGSLKGQQKELPTRRTNEKTNQSTEKWESTPKGATRVSWDQWEERKGRNESSI